MIWLAWYRLTATGPTPEPVQAHNLGEVPSTALSVFAAGLSSISGFFGASGPAHVGSFNLNAGYLLLGLLVIGVDLAGSKRIPLRRERSGCRSCSR